MPPLWPPSILWIDAFGAGVFTMTFAHHLDQWWRRRDRASHLWIALSALGALLVNLSGALIRETDGPPERWLSTINMLGIALALISLFELVRANAGRRASQIRRGLQVACLLPALLYALTGNETLLPLLYALSMAFMLGALGLTLREALAGDVEARVLGLGLCALFATLVYDLASELHVFPRSQGWPILGFSLLYLAATRAQSIRQEREYSELVSLRSELEARVRERTTELETANAHLDRLSRTDLLTGLANRRALIEQVTHWLASRTAADPAGSLVMIDIDHFKQINDYFGHDAGDRVLVQVADALVRSFGEGAMLARWGGEEFIAHLPGAGVERACEQAEAARVAVAGIRAGPADRRALSASFGVAALDAEGGLDRALAEADAALYRAKQSGRNRVVA
ncbi:MAG: GGDEF domain-containing protein [Arenimonas sp.]